MGRPKVRPPANESKAAKFSRLGTVRLTKAVAAIAAIGKLTTSNYKSDAEQHAKIITTLQAATTDLGKVLAGGSVGIDIPQL
jgi:hypothetical protein